MSKTLVRCKCGASNFYESQASMPSEEVCWSCDRLLDGGSHFTDEEYFYLLPYATPDQRKAIAAVLKYETQAEAADAIGLTISQLKKSLLKLRKKAAKKAAPTKKDGMRLCPNQDVTPEILRQGHKGHYWIDPDTKRVYVADV